MEQGIHKTGDHRSVGSGGILAPAEDIEVAEPYDFNVV